MARPKIKPDQSKMRPTAERLKSSNEAKLNRGERRVTLWLIPEAAALLKRRLGDDPERGALQHVVNAALIDWLNK
jgi:hypothetical protein